MSVSSICAAPFLFYRCSFNGFTGCCTTDPCNLSWCPDFEEPADKPFMSKPPEGLAVMSSSISQMTDASSTPNAQMNSEDNPSSSGTTSTDSPTPSMASTSSNSVSISTSEDVVIVFATSEVYVTSQPVTQSAYGTILSPITQAMTATTLSSMSVSSHTHTHTPTTTVTMAAPSRATVTATAKPRLSYAKRHEAEIIAGTIGSAVGILIAIGLIWFLLSWNGRRAAIIVRQRQIDDDPSMAGRDANRAGEYFHKDEGQATKVNNPWQLIIVQSPDQPKALTSMTQRFLGQTVHLAGQ